MAKTKTLKEIRAEITALKAAKPRVRERNIFGDSLHDAIDAQIVVLENGLTEDEIYERFSNRSELDGALDALAWEYGEEREFADSESLAAGWLAFGLRLQIGEQL